MPAVVAPGATTLTRMSAAPPYSLARIRARVDEGRLGPGVGQAALERMHALHAREQHDRAAGALGLHLLGAGAGQQHRRLEVRGEGRAQRRAVELLGLHPRGIAGEGDEAVELALHVERGVQVALRARPASSTSPSTSVTGPP